MLTKYDHFRAGERAENIVRKPAKRFTKRVEVSPNAKTHQVVEESIRALLEGFKETHDPKLEARNIKIELLCESYDTMFDAGAFFQILLARFKLINNSLPAFLSLYSGYETTRQRL